MAGAARELRQAPGHGRLRHELEPEPLARPSPRQPAGWREWHHVDAREATVLGGVMLGLAYLLPAVPGHPGLPCPLRTLTGVPCPMCGMTTSVEATVHLDLGAALAANPAGIALVVVAIALLVRRPRAVPVPPLPVTLTLLALMWVFELVRFGFI